MNNYVQEGTHESVVLTAAVVAGGVVVLGNRLGVAQKSGAVGDLISVSLRGVYTLAKTTGTAWTDGEKLYFNDDHTSSPPVPKVTTVAGSPALPVIGYAWGAALSAATTGQVKLLDL